MTATTRARMPEVSSSPDTLEPTTLVPENRASGTASVIAACTRLTVSAWTVPSGIWKRTMALESLSMPCTWTSPRPRSSTAPRTAPRSSVWPPGRIISMAAPPRKSMPRFRPG